MTEDEKKTIEQLFEAMERSGGRFVVGQVVGSQTIHINTGEEKKEDEVPNPPSCVQKDKGGRPKRAGQSINKAFIYDAGSQTNVRLQLFHKGLVAMGWIDAATDFRDFWSLFAAKETNCRVMWKGGVSTLAELFRELVTRKKLVQLPKGETLWVMVNARFWDNKGNVEFGNNRLRGTRAPIEAKDTIDMLIRVMNPEVPIELLKKTAQKSALMKT